LGLNPISDESGSERATEIITRTLAAGFQMSGMPGSIVGVEVWPKCWMLALRADASLLQFRL
jgi:hypothetical protein